MGLNSRWFMGMVAWLVILPRIAVATTIITNSRAQIAQMAGWWEVDSVQISSLANSLYPQFTNNWEYMAPSGSTASDGDEHINMAVDASNTGTTSSAERRVGKEGRS